MLVMLSFPIEPVIEIGLRFLAINDMMKRDWEQGVVIICNFSHDALEMAKEVNIMPCSCTSLMFKVEQREAETC